MSKYSVGCSDVQAVYDCASLLSLIDNSIGLDPDCEFKAVLHDLCNSAFDSLPQTFVVDLSDPDALPDTV